jgi:hypothetical protein
MNSSAENSTPLTKPWSAIAQQYAESSSLDSSVSAIAALVRHIEDSELSNGLFGWTSMFDLCITQTKVEHPHLGPYLRVKPTFDGKVEFRYIDTPDVTKQWHRTVPAEDTIQRLHGFLSHLHWFGPTLIQTLGVTKKGEGQFKPTRKR